MKKLSFILLVAILSIIGMTACNNTSEMEKKASQVAEKIDKGEPLSETDYNVMIQYVGDFAEKAQPIDDSIINDVNSEAAQKQLDSLKQHYPLIEKFRTSIHNARVSDLGPENVTLINHYGTLLEFTLPAGMSIEPVAGVAGMEVDTPDSSNGVIAGGVDTVENVRL